ncbi:amino acid ABC transporter permease [Nocardioides marmoriginsengisoli]|uniref:Amino acid ABC transporter permease n=1 Tax=Nocardioides marmoriginsengisoli TaxID=661483 RepID=A0A3N0CIN0_9ACTN|nr:amino acid ABC transporter permease [Nocardioides marmoriginsengisoli]RNL63300.1 amino acid ABC transporter permease [Nocardioides marmoriginsengisoli]
MNEPSPSGEKVIARKHYGRWITAVLIFALAAVIVRQFATADIDWGIIPDYLTSEAILKGLWGTIWLTVLAMVVGIVVGTAVAVMGLSDNIVLRSAASFYLWFFRGIPALVQLLIWFNIALVIKDVNLPPLYEGTTNDLVTPLIAAVLGLGLSEGASMGEIVRSGILSVDPGQAQAAKALGFTQGQTMRRVILPQAMRVIVPPTGNEIINMTKYTSLAFAVSYSELLSSATGIYSMNFKVVELLFTITIWYLALTTVLMFVQSRIERRLARSRGTEKKSRNRSLSRGRRTKGVPA